jgi:hypothetical protein
MIEWLTFTSTLITIMETDGWDAALHYAQQVLYERVDVGENFAPVSSQILEGLKFVRHTHQQRQPLGSPLNSPPRQGGMVVPNIKKAIGGPLMACNWYNWQKEGCPDDPCPFKHHCHKCGGPHQGKTCNPQRQPRTVTRRDTRSGSGGSIATTQSKQSSSTSASVKKTGDASLRMRVRGWIRNDSSHP